MSNKYNKDGLYVDTGFLRDHIYKLQNQKKLTNELYDCVFNIKALSDPSIAQQFDSLLRDIEQLSEYFKRISSSLTYIDDEAVRLSNTLGNIIEDNASETKHNVSNAIQL